MKKFIASLVSLVVGTFLFAVTPEELLVGTYNFATEEANSWVIYDPLFSTIDPISEEYTFKGGFVVKILIGYSRYNFTCTVKNGEDDFTVDLYDMTSFGCYKNGKKTENVKTFKTSDNVARQYAAQFKDEISNRIAAFNEAGTFEEEYTKVVTQPAFIDLISRSLSDLAMKKFVEKNVNGKTASFDVTVRSVDENTNILTGKQEELAYVVLGSVEVYDDSISSDLVIPKPFNIWIYSNNDKLLTIKEGATYKANGRAKVEKSSISTNWLYSIYEE